MVDYSSEVTGVSIEDPEIGTLKMYLKSWGVYGAGITFREVNTTLCTKDHFNDVEGSNT